MPGDSLQTRQPHTHSLSGIADPGPCQFETGTGLGFFDPCSLAASESLLGPAGLLLQRGYLCLAQGEGGTSLQRLKVSHRETVDEIEPAGSLAGFGTLGLRRRLVQAVPGVVVEQGHAHRQRGGRCRIVQSGGHFLLQRVREAAGAVVARLVVVQRHLRQQRGTGYRNRLPGHFDIEGARPVGCVIDAGQFEGLSQRQGVGCADRAQCHGGSQGHLAHHASGQLARQGRGKPPHSSIIAVAMRLVRGCNR